MLNLIYFSILISSLLSYLTKKKLYGLFWFTVIILVILAGARSSSYGADYTAYETYANYANSFNSIGSALKASTVEPTFTILARVTNGNVLLFLIYAFLGVFLKAWVFVKRSEYPWISILLYFQSYYFLGDMAQIRQSVAISFFFVFIHFACSQKPKYALVSLITSFLFHFSAFFLPLIYFFRQFFFWKNSVRLLLCLMVLASFFFSLTGVSLLNSFAGLIPSSYAQAKFSSYMNSVYGENIGLGFSDFFRIFICFALLFFVGKERVKNDFERIIIIGFILGSVIFFLLKEDGIFASRLTTYFKLLDCFLIPFLLKKLHDDLGQHGYLIGAFFIIIYSIASYYLNVFSVASFSVYQFGLLID